MSRPEGKEGKRRGSRAKNDAAQNWQPLERHLRLERKIKQDKYEYSSNDTFGATSHGYYNKRNLKNKVLNFLVESDINLEKMKRGGRQSKLANKDELIQNSVQCDSSYQKLLHSSQYSSNRGTDLIESEKYQYAQYIRPEPEGPKLLIEQQSGSELGYQTQFLREYSEHELVLGSVK